MPPRTPFVSCVCDGTRATCVLGKVRIQLAETSGSATHPAAYAEEQQLWLLSQS